MKTHPAYFFLAPRNDRGSVLIIVMWICLGLVTLTLYFANSMSSELHVADNCAQEAAARQAVAGGARYAAYVLKNYAAGGLVPDPTTDYQSEALPVGDATFWFIGRDNNSTPTTQPIFGLVDECSKLNLNTVTSDILQNLPGMTADLAQAIISWRSTSAANSSTDNTYSTLNPPRLNKASPFESVDELRLVYGATLDLLLGEDTNRNGALDPNEDDGDQSPPHDNQDGVLQPGIWEYVTVYSKQPNTRADGTNRINITTADSLSSLENLLSQKFGQARAAAILRNIGNRAPTSVAEFLVYSQMTADEFSQIHTDVTAGTGTTVNGLVNINTASATVLACIPGIGANTAASLIAYRQAHTDALTSMAWIQQVMSNSDIIRAGKYITDQSYQFSADIAAVGKSGRGYAREKFIFDNSSGTPRVIYHQDLSQYGWALGSQVRQNFKNLQ